MISELAVPFEWLLGAGALIASGLVYYVREKFANNDKAHDRIGVKMDRVDQKIDHILHNHAPKMPPFKER